MKTRRLSISPSALRRVVLLAILVAWEAVPRLGLAPKVLIAPLSATLSVGFEKAGMFAQALALPMTEIALGLVIAHGLGGVIGLVLGAVRPLSGTVSPLVSLFYTFPFVFTYRRRSWW